jgi:hypothetical protein
LYNRVAVKEQTTTYWPYELERLKRLDYFMAQIAKNPMGDDKKPHCRKLPS